MAAEPTVIVVGGGYCGVTTAQYLDTFANVTLVEERDRFVHNVGLLRGLVDAGFADDLTMPYTSALARGEVVHARVVQFDGEGVELSDGRILYADFVVLATGSGYPFPAKLTGPHIYSELERLADATRDLRSAKNVLIVGAGPVGVELAGEITSAWPGKSTTIIDRADKIVPGPYSDAFRDSLASQLSDRDVRVCLGVDLIGLPLTPAGVHAPSKVESTSGEPFDFDIWFRCFGGRPDTDYLGSTIVQAVRDDGRIDVEPSLQVAGYCNVFAVGDVTSVPEAKRAGVASGHARVVAANIRAIHDGAVPRERYVPGAARIVVPLGPDGGAGFAAGVEITQREVLESKGKDLNVARVRGQLLGRTSNRGRP
ncbi:NAD(P)/FAD-dependent oxidoreductase [Rhodococcus sp. NCIMB 12038]|uniref:NAD(P)/FAD-dependent oxidoreductase n=1 Tax=Rhodococcus sp. NCIMB 12038 TaxID=933800 RepID=UPI000B3D4318|nr:FAD-dependent oxidoreductase [Rhodococcus sp. NCIMB 12038]OUS79651.1 hypothetical protein CA951_42490 [Rhodococcus sp. NCIMB 12038]